MFTKRTLSTVAVAAALAGTAASASPAQAITCSASAVRGTVLGQVVEPVVAGGASGCADQTAALSALPAPLSGALGASTRLTGPADDPTQQRAGSMATVENLSIGALRGLGIELPAAQLPTGLRSLEIPLPEVPLPDTGDLPIEVPTVPTVPGLPGVPQIVDTSPLPTSTGDVGSLLPPSIVIDALPAVQDLVPVRNLPDVPLAAVGALRSAVGASCLNGLPNLLGNSAIEGLRGLGETLPTDVPVDRAVRLLEELTIPLTQVDLSKVALPAGLSFDDPVVGPVLRDAVRDALAALPPVVVPGMVGNVQTAPAEQTATDGSLEQRALRMTVSMAGQKVADLVLGIARIATDGLRCSKAAPAVKGIEESRSEAPSEAPVPPGIAPATQLAVSCMDSRVGLIDIRDKGDHVWVRGAADKKLVGRKVRIVSAWNGKTVKTTWVRESGYFKTRAPMPREGIRYSNDTRYVAMVAGETSNALKLHREMRFTKIITQGRKVTLEGRIFAPLAKGEAINIRQYVNCDERKIVAKAHPRKDGTFKVTVTAPEDMNAVSYLAYTEVLNDMRKKKFPTFTLQGYVSL